MEAVVHIIVGYVRPVTQYISELEEKDTEVGDGGRATEDE